MNASEIIKAKAIEIAENEQKVFNAGYAECVENPPKNFLDVNTIGNFAWACSVYDYHQSNRSYTDTECTVQNALFEKFRQNAIDTSKITDFTGLFYYRGKRGFTDFGELKEIDVGNATSLAHTFAYCGGISKLPKLINTHKITNFYFAFCGCDGLTDAPEIDTRNATTLENTFSGCEKIASFPVYDTSKVTSFRSTFSGCTSLTELPLVDTSNATNMTFFAYEDPIVSFPQYNTSKVTAMRNMVELCTKLTDFPTLDTANVTDAFAMFRDCTAIKEIPAMNTPKLTSANQMFKKCTALEKIKGLDMQKVTSNTDMFVNCYALTECWLKNIKKSLQIGSGTTYGHLITLECLLFLIKEVIKGTTTIKLTVGSANLAKLDGIYVKLIEVTDEMRAEDEFIDSKYPFEVCESTDEGAMLINDYYSLKNLTLA